MEVRFHRFCGPTGSDLGGGWARTGDMSLQMKLQFKVNTLLRIIALFCIDFCLAYKLFSSPSVLIFPEDICQGS